MTSRGIRLNNPGLIRKSDDKWQGLAPVQLDKDFCTYITPQYGIRALARNFMSYQRSDGCKTVRQIISRHAPPEDNNNTPAYVAAVLAGLKAAGVCDSADDEIDVDSVDVMLPLVKAIILHENGQNPYPDSLILEGLHMAGVADAKPKPLVKQTPFLAQVGGGIAVVATGATHAASYAPTVKGWADQLSAFTGSPIIQHVQTIMLTVAGGLVLLGIAAAVLKQRTA